MRYLRWIFNLVLAALVLAVLHYMLPQWDTVRISETREVRNESLSSFWCPFGDAEDQAIRDQSQIQAVTAKGKPSVFRNEDKTPYLKWNSSDVQTIASNLRSTADAPKWVAIKHYGWRLQFCSEYPNVLKIKEVESADSYVVPWISIGILVILFALYWAIRVRWVRFREDKIDPIFDAIDDWIDGAFAKKK